MASSIVAGPHRVAQLQRQFVACDSRHLQIGQDHLRQRLRSAADAAGRHLPNQPSPRHIPRPAAAGRAPPGLEHRHRQPGSATGICLASCTKSINRWTSCTTPLRDSGKVVAMAPDEQQEQRRQPDEEARVAADLAALSARVESLERQLAELRAQPSGEIPANGPSAAPPASSAAPKTSPTPRTLPNTFPKPRDRSKTGSVRRSSAASGLWLCWSRPRCF